MDLHPPPLPVEPAALRTAAVPRLQCCARLRHRQDWCRGHLAEHRRRRRGRRRAARGGGRVRQRVTTTLQLTTRALRGDADRLRAGAQAYVTSDTVFADADAELDCAGGLLDELAEEQVATARQADQVMAVWWAATAVLPAWSPPLQVLACLVVDSLQRVRAEHRLALARLTAAFDRLTTGARAVGGALAAQEAAASGADPTAVPAPDAAAGGRRSQPSARGPGFTPARRDGARKVLATLADAQRGAASAGPVLLLGYRSGAPRWRRRLVRGSVASRRRRDRRPRHR